MSTLWTTALEWLKEFRQGTNGQEGDRACTRGTGKAQPQRAEVSLERGTTISKMEIVQSEGGREVTREVEFYNLDAIIGMGFRVNSYQPTQFRSWATKTLCEFLIKGFVAEAGRDGLKIYLCEPA